MSVRKHEYNLMNRDPIKVAELQEVIDEMWSNEIAELRALGKPHQSPFKIDVKRRDAGEAWLAEAAKSDNAGLARDNRKAAKLRLLSMMMDLMIQPRQKAEQAEVDDEHSKRAQLAEELLKAVEGHKNVSELKQLRTITDDEVNIPHAVGSDPDEPE